MYDKKLKKWVSDCRTEQAKQLVNDPDQVNNPEVLFLKTSQLLLEIEIKENLVRAVADMEKLSNENYLPAVFAMGQMFEYGWGVHKDRKKALALYTKAAKEGYKPAVEIIEGIKRARKKKIITIILLSILVIGIAIAAVFIVSDMFGGAEIKVNEDTELKKVSSVDELNEEVTEFFSAYDNEDIIKNKSATNRIITKFEGKEIDLSDFKADKIISQQNNVLIIQFSDEKEAKRCLEYLRNQDNVIFAEMDIYNNKVNEVGEKYCTLSPVDYTTPTNDYISWGVADMGLDRLSEHVRENYSDEEILVAVIDTGALIHSAYADRCNEGINIVTGGAVVPAVHGTHVTGTVLDGADSDNIRVWNLDVFNGEDGASVLAVSTAVYQAIDAGADVINMSLGSAGCSYYEDLAIQDAINAGITVVIAAGNETVDATTTPCCPAHNEAAITVGAYNIDHKIADFSNYGDCVDVCAPGVAIWSLSHIQDGSFTSLNGTSMASPHIAALAALIKSINPDTSAAAVEEMICNSCRVFTNPSEYGTGRYGYGAPDATVFIEGEDTEDSVTEPGNQLYKNTDAVFPDFYEYINRRMDFDADVSDHENLFIFPNNSDKETVDMVLDYVKYITDDFDFELVDATENWVGLKYTGKGTVKNYASTFYNGSANNSVSLDFIITEIPIDDSGKTYDALIFRFSADLKPTITKEQKR